MINLLLLRPQLVVEDLCIKHGLSLSNYLSKEEEEEDNTRTTTVHEEEGEVGGVDNQTRPTSEVTRSLIM